MFYAPEILSYKNRTEISLVYYLSTAKNPKAVRKTIINLDFASIIDQIQNPKTPFALRLYSYLLKGLVRIWMMKIDFYKGQINTLFLKDNNSTKKRKPPTVSVNTSNNLQVLDQFIISDIYIPSVSTCEDERTCLPESHGVDFDFDCTAESLPSNGNTFSLLKKKIDEKTQLTPDEIFVKRLKTDSFEVPSLIDCFAVRVFESAFKADGQTEIPMSGFDLDNGSIEDPRISSSSLSHERALVEKFEEVAIHNENSFETARANWFYSILLSATRGEVKIIQDQPFSEIKILPVSK
ncbi:hypothetical protein GINT2_001496 [Glugoides intestinalis]